MSLQRGSCCGSDYVAGPIEADAASSGRREKLVLAGSLALLVQCAALTVWAELEGWPTAFVLVITVSAVAFLLNPRARHTQLWKTHTALVGGLGGLAMLVGMWFDGSGPHTSHVGHTLMGFWSWSTAGMLVVCFSGCLLVHGKPRNKDLTQSPLPYVGGLVGMLIGMAAGGVLLADVLALFLGSMVAARHLAMVIGMTLGTLIGTWVSVRFEYLGRQHGIAPPGSPPPVMNGPGYR